MDESSGTMTGLSVTGCERCPALAASRSQIVNGVGPADAELVIVGEAPGATEDERGEPFVGRSGQLLTDALESVGFSRNGVRITNCVRCRPPDNRNPRSAERSACFEWLSAELSAIDPRLVMAVGKIPASQLLDRDVAVMSAAGSIEDVRFGTEHYPVLVSPHPAAVLYDRSTKDVLERSLRIAAKRLGVTPSIEQTSLGEF